MGSFYGQVIQEFTKAFTKFNITHNSVDDNPVDIVYKPTTDTTQLKDYYVKQGDEYVKHTGSFEPGTTYYIKDDNASFNATSMWEEIDIQPGNRWIRLNGDTDASNKTLTISHGTAGAVSHTAAGDIIHFVVTSDSEPVQDKIYYTLNENEYSVFSGDEFTTGTIYYEKVSGITANTDIKPIQLKNGEVFTIPVTQYDKAGHLAAKPSCSYLKLPVATVNIGEDKDIIPGVNEKLTFKGDGQWITLNKDEDALKFEHTILTKKELTPEEGSEKEPGFNEFYTFIHLDNDKSPTKASAIKEEIDKAGAGVNPYPESVNTIISAWVEEKKDPDIYKLTGGELIKVKSVAKDFNGHILEEPQEVYLQLPQNASEQDFSKHNGQISNLEKRLSGWSSINDNDELIIDPEATAGVGSNGRYEDNLLILKAHEDFLTKDFPEGMVPPTLHALTGDFKVLYETVPKEQTLAGVIGKIDGNEGYSSAIATLVGDKTDTIYSISEAIRHLADVSNDLDEEGKGIKSRLTAIETQLLNLESRLQKLEGQAVIK